MITRQKICTAHNASLYLSAFSAHNYEETASAKLVSVSFTVLWLSFFAFSVVKMFLDLLTYNTPSCSKQM